MVKQVERRRLSIAAVLAECLDAERSTVRLQSLDRRLPGRSCQLFILFSSHLFFGEWTTADVPLAGVTNSAVRGEPLKQSSYSPLLRKIT